MDKKANTPLPHKAGGKLAAEATNSTQNAKHGKQVTRENTQSREEVRQQTVAEKGHSK